jgi:oxygen-independent coproporphyrinogen-3 oxidase
MKLIIDGNVSRTYVQNLCLLFFPGAKFSESEEITPDTPILQLIVRENEESIYASADLTLGDVTGHGEHTERFKASITHERSLKIAVGKAVYTAGGAVLGDTPAWGILTGIRPAKIARQIYSATPDAAKVRKVLRDEYFLNPKKAALLTQVAINESKIIEALPANACSLYVSIPFCPSRCAYCSFVSFATKRLLSLMPAYVERLLEDLDQTFALIRELGMKITTVYIGGGTPTTLSAGQMEQLLSKICENVDPDSLEEFTVEAGRPDTVTAEKLAVIASHGVSRISINPQTLNDEVLRGIGRHHTVDDFYRAYDMARESGIPEINTDLIAGLPGDSYRSFAKSVDAILKLEPDNLTVHTFCVKTGADLAHSGGAIYSPVNGEAQKSVDYSQLRAKNSGYIPYYLYRQKNAVGNLENVGFSLPGKEGKYNVYIMEEIHPIFAVGAGASTKIIDPKTGKIRRIFMNKYPYEYLSDEQKARFQTDFLDEIRKFYGE